MMNTFRLVLLNSAILSVIAELTPQENTARLQQIDYNTNGLIELNEAKIGLLYRASQGKNDLKRPPTSIEIAHQEQNNPVYRLLVSEFFKDRGNKPQYQFQEIKADIDFRLPAPSAGSAPDLSGPPQAAPSRWFLRRSLDKMPLSFEDPDQNAADLKKSTAKLAELGALFSYGRHFESHSDQWVAEGAFGYELPFIDGIFGKTTTGRYLFTLGFSRIDFGGEGEPKNASPRFRTESSLLALGTSYESLINFPMFGSFEGSVFRANAVWKTDWDIESHIPGLELEWTPLNGRWGMGSFNTCFDSLWWRWEPVLHADVGHVLEDGDWTKHPDDATFAHIGPKVSVNLMPFPKFSLFQSNPVVLTVSYGQYAALTEDSRETRTFTAEASWFLRKPGSGNVGPVDPGIALTVSYRNFDDVENQQEDDSLIVGVSVGF